MMNCILGILGSFASIIILLIMQYDRNQKKKLTEIQMESNLSMNSVERIEFLKHRRMQKRQWLWFYARKPWKLFW